MVEYLLVLAGRGDGGVVAVGFVAGGSRVGGAVVTGEEEGGKDVEDPDHPRKFLSLCSLYRERKVQAREEEGRKGREAHTQSQRSTLYPPQQWRF